MKKIILIFLKTEYSGRVFSSTEKLLNFYASKIERSFRNMQCKHTGADANRQFAMLITDCWSIGTEYTTFYEASWYDNLSASNTVKESYYTVDMTTGRAASITDFIKEGKMTELAEMMIGYLKDSHGDLWIDDESHHNQEPLAVLRAMDGCGLIREGLIVYFHPYHIASGSEGQISAILPYTRIKEFIKDNLL